MINDTRFKSFILNGSILASSFILGLAVLEFFFRVFWQPGSATNRTGLEPLIVFDSKLETRYAKNTSASIQSPYHEFEIVYSTNDIGLRDSGIFLKQDKLSRILVLGNSYVEGWGVAEEDRFTDIAEKYFNDETKRKIDLVNAGMSGYGVLQSYLLLKDMYGAIEPNHIVFFYMSTMSLADARFKKIADFDDEGTVIGLDVNYLLSEGNEKESEMQVEIPKLVARLAELSYTVRYFLERYRNRLLIANLKPGDLSSDLFATFRNRAAMEYREKIYDHLLKMKSFVESKNVGFTLVYLPTPLQISDMEWTKGKVPYQFKEKDFDANEKIVKKFCRKNALNCFFPSRHLREISNLNERQKLFFDYDFHLNVVGNEVLGLWFSDLLGEIVE